MKRVTAYIDGYNFYHGLKDAQTKHSVKNPNPWQRRYWINVHLLTCNLLSKDKYRVDCTKYFTARVSEPPDRVKRQSTFLDALATIPDLNIKDDGHFKIHSTTCRSCGTSRDTRHEKMTDVNIAVEMLTDAFQDKFDALLLISADSDLLPPIKTIRRLYPEKEIIVAFPPFRYSKDLQDNVHRTLKIKQKAVVKSLLPETVASKNGILLKNPWP